MQLTSFHKMLLGVGAGVAVVGGGVGLLVARHHRKGDEEASYRATPVSVDEFVDRAIHSYDVGAWGSPLEEPKQDAARTPDGKLTLGAEDVRTTYDDRQFYPELVGGVDPGYYHVVSGREFLRTADTDADGHVTRDELTNTVKPYAGSDGKLDEAERRQVIQEGGLAERVEPSKLRQIAGWSSVSGASDGSLTTASEAARLILRTHAFYQEFTTDEGSSAVTIKDLRTEVPWGQDKKSLRSGPITSLKAAYTAIDEEVGNANGLLSQRELATWLAKHRAVEGAVHGHIKDDYDGDVASIKPQVIARIDASTLDGHAYYSTKVPKADVDRFYGGSIPKYVDAIEGFKQLRGSAEWQPDPAG